MSDRIPLERAMPQSQNLAFDPAFYIATSLIIEHSPVHAERIQSAWHRYISIGPGVEHCQLRSIPLWFSLDYLLQHHSVTIHRVIEAIYNRQQNWQME